MVLVLTALAACSSGKGKPLESGDITKENVSQVCEILNEAGLSNVDVFENPRKLRKCLALPMPTAV